MRKNERLLLYVLAIEFLVLFLLLLRWDIDEKRVSPSPVAASVNTLVMTVDTVEPEDVGEPRGGYVYFNTPLGDELEEYIFDICTDYGIAPELIVSMIFHESNFDSAVIGTNDSGYSYGLMQIMPRWNQARMEKLGCLDLLNPYQNVLVGADLMAEYIGEGHGVAWALMAYNGGPSYANRKLAEGTVSSYATRVMDYAEMLRMATVEGSVAA